jgi:hypothetical protein
MLTSVALAVVLGGSFVPWSVAQSGSAARMVQGEVVAVNLQSTPRVIVVKVLLPSQQEMIVGATVGADTAITHGKQTIGLDAIKPGQIVRVTYLKSENGLEARSIQVRK